MSYHQEFILVQKNIIRVQNLKHANNLGPLLSSLWGGQTLRIPKTQESCWFGSLQACFSNTVNIQGLEDEVINDGHHCLNGCLLCLSPNCHSNLNRNDQNTPYQSKQYLPTVCQLVEDQQKEFLEDLIKNLRNQLVSCKQVSRGTALQRYKILS